MNSERPTVLVIEDEPPLVEIYSQWLSSDYHVLTAMSGTEALAEYDERVDVLLIDRLMPGMSGDEVVSELTARDGDPAVAMVTAVEPDFDLLGMGVDAYLTKPVTREDLLETVERLLERRQLAEKEREFYRLVSKSATLQSSKDAAELAASEEFSELNERISTLREELVAAGVLDDAEFVARIRDLDRGSHVSPEDDDDV